MGCKNRTDNLEVLGEHSRYYEAKMTLCDFKALVFLHAPVLKFVCLQNRSLEQTAKNAIIRMDEGEVDFGPDWDLSELVEEFEKFYDRIQTEPVDLRHLLLRDAKQCEKTHPNAEWYLQDGCHRALGYMIYLLRENGEYTTQSVYLATNRVLP